MYKNTQMFNRMESKSYIVKVLCICAKVTKICQYNEYHLFRLHNRKVTNISLSTQSRTKIKTLNPVAQEVEHTESEGWLNAYPWLLRAPPEFRARTAVVAGRWIDTRPAPYPRSVPYHNEKLALTKSKLPMINHIYQCTQDTKQMNLHENYNIRRKNVASSWKRRPSSCTIERVIMVWSKKLSWSSIDSASRSDPSALDAIRDSLSSSFCKDQQTDSFAPLPLF